MMTLHRRQTSPAGIFGLFTLIFAIAGSGSRPAAGQDPVGGSAKPATPASGAEQPKPKPGESPTPESGAAAKPEAETDPLVLAIRDTKPSTPEALTRTVEMLIDLGRPDVAKSYLQQLAAAAPDQQVLASLQRQFGSALFLRWIRDDQLAPEGRQLGRAVLDAAHQATRDRQRLDDLVARLNDPSVGVRATAMLDLREAGEAAVAPLVDVLADASRSAEEHARAREALVYVGAKAVEPLIGALEAPDEALRVQIIEVLGGLRAQRAALYLIRPHLAEDSSPSVRQAAGLALARIFTVAPSPAVGRQYLHERVLGYLKGEPPLRPDLEGRIQLWHWDAQKKAAAPVSYEASLASLAVASRAAADLSALAPQNEELQQLNLIVQLKWDKLRLGLERPLGPSDSPAYSLAADAGADVVDKVLAQAIRMSHVEAAIGAADVLAGIGDPSLLDGEAGQVSPLVTAVCHVDRRLRFAAAAAILKLDPQRLYAGASRLPETLGHLVRAAGASQALIGHPRSDQARSLAGRFNEMGFETALALTGREVYRQAQLGSDLEFLLLSDSLDDPAVDPLIQMLRRDWRTAQLPIGLMAREENMGKAAQLAEQDPLTWAFPRLHTEQEIARATTQLLALAGASRVSGQERLRQAAASLDQLARLAESPDRYGFYELLRQQEAVVLALNTPALSVPAARVLAHFGSPLAQRALVDFASQPGRLLAARQAAAVGFGAAIRRHGMGLTSSEILLQYDRYNQSAALDRDTQKLLGSILDLIEARGRQSGEQEEASRL